MKKLKAKIGASVIFCGHDGWFPADIWVMGGEPSSATHHLVDFPKPGFWKPSLGVFVVPVDQVRVLR